MWNILRAKCLHTNRRVSTKILGSRVPCHRVFKIVRLLIRTAKLLSRDIPIHAPAGII